MKKQNTPQPVPEVGSPQWQGYTLSELQYRRDVNFVRQELLLEQLKSTLGEIRHRQEQSSLLGYVTRMDSFLNIAQYGIMGISVFSRIKSFFRKLKGR